MAGPFLEEEDDVNELADFGAAGGGIPNAPSRLPKTRRTPRRGFQGPNTMYSADALAAADFAGQAVRQHQLGLNAHNAHLNDVNKTIGDEMDSRVAQSREMRRMAHEKELMRLRMEAQKQEQEGAMIRALLNG